jgi:predicted flap endonuclease-1-like 5' DNA nuclease
VLEIESGRGIPNLTVKAFDKDLRYDDSLGVGITDANGRFVIEYNEKDFRELIFDRKPDLYLTISDYLGTVIKSTKNRIRYGAGKKEGFYVRLPKKTVSKIPQPKKKEKPKKKGRKKLKLKIKGIPLEAIPGIGPSRAKKLRKCGVSDAQAFAKASEKKLKEILGNLDIKNMKRDCNKLIKKK